MPRTARRPTCRCAGPRSTAPTIGGAERWNLFYLSNSDATGAQPMWTNVGGDYTFGADGALNPADRLDRPDRASPSTASSSATCALQARHRRHHPVRRSQRHRRGHGAQPERLSGGRVRLGRDQRQRPRRGVLQQRPAGRSGAGGDGQLQRRQPAQAPRRRRVRGDLGIRASRSSTPTAASSALRSKRPTPTSRRNSPS